MAQFFTVLNTIVLYVVITTAIFVVGVAGLVFAFRNEK